MKLLDAINDILRNLDLDVISSVADKQPSTETVKSSLDQQSSLIQSKGYFFNTSKQKFNNTVGNEVFIPDDVIKIKSTDYAIRGNRIYDLKNATFTISEPVEVDAVTVLSFSDLPYPAAYYVMCLAALDSMMKLVPDVEGMQVMRIKCEEARRKFNEYIIESNRPNFLDNKTSIWSR